MKPLHYITDKVIFKGSQEEFINGRFRAFFVCSYATHEQLRDLFVYCEKFAFITHDKDVKEDGSPKMTHCHFIIRYRDALTPSAFGKKIARLASSEQTEFSPLGDKYCAIDYMLHRDSKSAELGKHLYKDTDILTDDLAYFFRTKEEEKAKHNNEEFFNDLLDGNLSKREMALKYGRDYAKNLVRYDQFAKEVAREEYVATLPQSDLDNLRENGVDVAGIVWQLLHKYAPRIKAGCTIPTYDYIKYDVDQILIEQITGD